MSCPEWFSCPKGGCYACGHVGEDECPSERHERIRREEKGHECAYCGELVVDEISEYVNDDDTKVWACDSCYERGVFDEPDGTEQSAMVANFATVQKGEATHVGTTI